MTHASCVFFTRNAHDVTVRDMLTATMKYCVLRARSPVKGHVLGLNIETILCSTCEFHRVCRSRTSKQVQHQGYVKFCRPPKHAHNTCASCFLGRPKHSRNKLTSSVLEFLDSRSTPASSLHQVFWTLPKHARNKCALSCLDSRNTLCKNQPQLSQWFGFRILQLAGPTQVSFVPRTLLVFGPLTTT